MGDFKALKVWQQGMDIAEKCIKLVADFPKDAVFNLGEQIKRSAISISSNIAEGNSRTSNKEYFIFCQSHWALVSNWKTIIVGSKDEVWE